MATALLLFLLLLAAAALLWLQLARQRRRPAPRSSPTLFDLELGDLVQFEGRDWFVENRLLYNEDGFCWLEYLLRDGSSQGWLSVEEDDWLELNWFEPCQTTEPLPRIGWQQAFPQALSWQGRDYRLQGQGKARLESSLRVMAQPQETCRYADYAAEDGSLLALELWPEGRVQGAVSRVGELELSLGRRLEPASVAVLPGDGRSVYRPEAAGSPLGRGAGGRLRGGL
jgi:hypothetical protein